jgi:anti-anti-sigma factor
MAGRTPVAHEPLLEGGAVELRRNRGVPDRHSITLTCVGEIDHKNWETFSHAIVDCARTKGVTAVLLDLSGVTFFDSGGIRAVIAARKALAGSGVAIHLERSSPRVDRLFEETGLIPYFPPRSSP